MIIIIDISVATILVNKKDVISKKIAMTNVLTQAQNEWNNE